MMMDRPTLNKLKPRGRSACPNTKQLDPAPAFAWLIKYIDATKGAEFLSSTMLENGMWRASLKLDLSNPAVWNVIQSYACALHGVVDGVSEPVRFYPFSRLPENGKPQNILIWCIESWDSRYSPDTVVGMLSAEVSTDLTPWPPRVAQ